MQIARRLIVFVAAILVIANSLVTVKLWRQESKKSYGMCFFCYAQYHRLSTKINRCLQAASTFVYHLQNRLEKIEIKIKINGN